MLGCGGPVDGRYGISGTVNFQGRPLDQGSVEFVSADGGQQTGAMIQSGRFSIAAAQGLPPGTYTVRIYSVEDTSAETPEAPGPEAMQQVGKERIPPEYNVNSKLTIEVTAAGPNEFELNVP